MQRLGPLAQELVARAQASGRLRADVAGSDLPLIQVMLGAVVDVTRDVAPETWRRMLALMIDGLRAGEPRTPLPSPALDAGQIDHAMRSWKPSPC